MSSSIKIVHNNTARRLTVDETTKWSDIADRLSSLFQLRPSTAIILSYVDSDNDTITLSTVAELQEAIAQGINKFAASVDGSESPEDWIMPGSETPRTVESAFESLRVSDEIPAPLYPGMTESDEQPAPKTSSYQTTLEDAEGLPQYNEGEEKPRLDKGKQKEEETGESSRAKEEDGSFPFEQIQAQLQTLCEQFKDVIEQNPQLLETANSLMDQLVQHIPVDIDIFSTFLGGFRPEDNQSRPFEFVFGPGPFRRGSFGGPLGRGPCPWERGPGFRGPQSFGMTGHPFFFGHPQTRRGCSRGGFRGGFRDQCGGAERQCQEKMAPRGGWVRARHGACDEKRGEAPEASEADTKAKIEGLNAMGFYETHADETFEELLSRYGGNMDRVVQVLLQRQQGDDETGKVKGYNF